MKKLLVLAFTIAILLTAGSAFGQSNNTFPPVDLPSDHWAYEAVKAMFASGILEGYPGNEFQGNRSFTRYEFAIAITRVFTYIEKTGVGAEDVATLAMIDALGTEFAAELADIQAQVDANTAAIDDLSSSLSSLGTRVDAVEKKLGNITWDGDFRFRLAYQDSEGMDTQRFRERMRLRLNFSAPIIEDQLKFYGRLATGPGGTSTNQTLDNNFTNYGVGLDLAYLDYQPTWIPWSTHMYFGRFKNFLDTSNSSAGFIWDSDLNFDGTGQSIALPQFGGEMFGTWKFNAVQGIMNENGGQAFDNEDDEWLIGWQVGAKDFITPKLNWYVSYYHFQNLVGGGNNFAADGYAGNLAGGDIDVNLDGAINNFDSIATKYNVFNVGANYQFQLSETAQPFYVHLDYVSNLNPEIPFSVDTRLGIGDDDLIGWLGGFRYSNAKEAGTCDFGYYYKNVGATAVVGNFSDADDFGANVIAHNLFFDYAITDNTLFQFEYILHDLKNELEHLPSNTIQTLHLDLVVKF
jgi:hypothetical protein